LTHSSLCSVPFILPQNSPPSVLWIHSTGWWLPFFPVLRENLNFP
jgi:hypothetical protein